MDDRLLLDKIDIQRKQVNIGGKMYDMIDCDLPTLDPENPYELSAEENEVIDKLRHSFVRSERLQKDIRFLYSKGSLYKVYNSNLLYHGCVPLNDDGSFKAVNIEGEKYSGKALYDVLDHYARRGFYSHDPEKERARYPVVYLGRAQDSPVFGKDRWPRLKDILCLIRKHM